jgi:hypothetical protein
VTFTPLQEKARTKIRHWLEEPVVFARECLKAEPDEWQIEVLEAYKTHQRIALKASKGPGKSTVMAWIGWHYLLTRPHPKVIATSISGDNLRDGLWAEMAKWQRNSQLLQAAFTWSAERIVAKDHPETWWASGRQWSKTADQSQQANTLAGVHAKYVLVMADEVGGIPDGVIAAGEAALSTGPDTRMVIAGNPTHLSGPLYRACTRERHMWFVKEISGDPDDPKRAPRVSIQWARDQIEKYGRDNPYVLVNVFGKFPPGQSNALLGVEDVTASAHRTLTEAEYSREPKILGVDVARFGDDESVVFPRQGRAAMRPVIFRNLELMELVGQVALRIERWRPDAVFIDETGVGGGVVDRLRQLGHEIQAVNFGARPLRPEPKVADRRTEMWWHMAEWVKHGGCIPDDPQLISELTAPTYKFDAQNRVRLESKNDMKARGVGSPDRGDALALTFAMPVQARNHAYEPFGFQNELPQKRRRDFDPLSWRGH